MAAAVDTVEHLVGLALRLHRAVQREVSLKINQAKQRKKLKEKHRKRAKLAAPNRQTSAEDIAASKAVLEKLKADKMIYCMDQQNMLEQQVKLTCLQPVGV